MKKRLLATLLAVLSFISPTNTFAAKGDQGIDSSIWNGYQVTLDYVYDKLPVLQIDGRNNCGTYDQVIYPSQVASTAAQGKRVYTYV